MKQLFIGLIIGLLVCLISACSQNSDTRTTLAYVKGASLYVGKAIFFKNQAPILLSKAALSDEGKKELEKEITNFQQDIRTFNRLTPPSTLTDIHTKMVAINKPISVTLDESLSLLKEGKLTEHTIQEMNVTEQLNNLQKLKPLLDDIKQVTTQ